MNYLVFDALLDAVFVIDQDVQLVYVNPVAANVCQTSLKRMKPGMPLTKFIKFEAEAELAIFSRLNEINGAVPYREFSFTTQSGSTGLGQVSVQKNPGTAVQWVIFIHDVSLEQILQKKYRAELEEKEEVIEDLRHAQKELQSYSYNLEKMVADRTRELHEANILLKGILDSLGQGFLVVSKGGDCLSLFSAVCEDILETLPAGKKIWDVLRVPDDELDSFKQWLMATYEELIPFNDLADLGPKSFRHSEKREIFLGYYPLRDDKDGSLKGIIVVATDRTAEVQALHEAQKERAYVRMVVRIIRNRRQFAVFVADTQRILGRLKSLFLSPQNYDYQTAFRYLHTIKGAAASFALHDLQEKVHQEENHLAGCKENITKQQLQEFHSRAIALEVQFSKFLNDNQYLFNAKSGEGRRVDLRVSDLVHWIQNVSHFPGMAAASLSIIEQYIKEPIEKSLDYVNDMLSEAAETLSKKIDPVEFINGGVYIIPENYAELLQNLIHVFRNSLDHGIEIPEIRRLSGKDEAGKIIVSMERIGAEGQPWLRIRISDDGLGVDVDSVRNRLLKDGKNVALECDEKVIQHIFDDSFTTRESVSRLSGRGVGMSAVRRAVENLKGKIIVESTLGQGTQITIEVPENNSLLHFMDNMAEIKRLPAA